MAVATQTYKQELKKNITHNIIIKCTQVKT